MVAGFWVISIVGYLKDSVVLRMSTVCDTIFSPVFAAQLQLRELRGSKALCLNLEVVLNKTPV